MDHKCSKTQQMLIAHNIMIDVGYEIV